jgi:isoleucyl-tRNA synthetase
MSLEFDLHDKYTPAVETSVLSKWKECDYVNAISSNTSEYPEYVAMDGPPFVSSKSMHYGHLLVGNAKSTVFYYKSMNENHVRNVIGFDCHGLPIEMEVNKLLGISNNDEVEQMGIDVYNAKCKSTVNSYSGAWEGIFDRIGRPADFSNDYKTMDPNFMESVWWGFSELYKKNLAYEGYAVVPYSYGCNTSLSNFEAKQNYKDKNDASIYVKFPVMDKEKTFLIAWTTTPWTVPSHLALAVNPSMKYVTVHDKKADEYYILAESNLVNLFKKKSEYTITETCTGTDLVGTEYKQPFDYFESYRSMGAFRVYADTFVKVSEEDESAKKKPVGTGVVHCAPGFGAEDFNMCTKHFIPIEQIGDVCPVDENGCFTSPVEEYKGENVFSANNKILKQLKSMGVVLKQVNCRHKYPYCWRTDTPLIYKAVKSFFVRVTSIKDRMVELNKKIYWVPDFVGHKRFHEWLKDAKDWGISRSRFFGTPLPVWVSDDGEEMVVVGSIDELVEKAGLTERPTDLHREFIDKIQIPSTKGKGMLKRVPDVFDCWFESGSVPYAQFHYPMENKHIFDDREYLSDFICEGLDQTRGWFYTLMVLSTALFDKPAFKNCICTGLILASDGKKMSKRLKNYPDPFDIISEYGADALRMYLLGSPAVKAGSFCFSKTGVYDEAKTLMPWFGALKFFNSHVSNYISKRETFNASRYSESDNVMDKWILSRLGTLSGYVKENMDALKLYAIYPKLKQFIEDFTNWYIKFNRIRLKGIGVTTSEWEIALSVLFKTLEMFSRITGPFMPFMADYMYSHLKKFITGAKESVHLTNFPSASDFTIDEEIERKMSSLQETVVLVRNLRNRNADFTSIKVPIKSVTIGNDDEEFLSDIRSMSEYFYDEVNCLHLNFVSLDGNVKYAVKTNNRSLGKRFRKDAKKVKEHIMKLDESVIKNIQEGKMEVIEMDIGDRTFTVTSEDIIITPELNVEFKDHEEGLLENGLLVIVDFTKDKSVTDEYTNRMLNYHVQQMRKQSNLKSVDTVTVYYKSDSEFINTFIETNAETLLERIRAPLKQYPEEDIINPVCIKTVDVADYVVTFTLVKE